MMLRYYGNQNSSAIIGLKVAKPRREGGILKFEKKKWGAETRYQGEENEEQGVGEGWGTQSAKRKCRQGN